MRERWSRKDRNAAALRIAGAYSVLAVVTTAIALALRDEAPWIYAKPWIVLRRGGGLAASALLGLLLAFVVVASTRFAVAHSQRVRLLHSELRPVAMDLTLGQILLIAGLSSLGEELLFRGLLTPTLGVVPAAILFGLAHQIKGPSRWVWVAWATGVGGALGVIFVATGSLAGPVLAHAIVNAVNLTFLRDHDLGAAMAMGGAPPKLAGTSASRPPLGPDDVA